MNSGEGTLRNPNVSQHFKCHLFDWILNTLSCILSTTFYFAPLCSLFCLKCWVVDVWSIWPFLHLWGSEMDSPIIKSFLLLKREELSSLAEPIFSLGNLQLILKSWIALSWSRDWRWLMMTNVWWWHERIVATARNQ